MRVIYVYGPPGAGKWEYVQAHARSEDMVIDRTALAKALYPFTKAPKITRPIHELFVFAITKFSKQVDGTTWIIETGPNFNRRKRWMRVADDSILINPGREACFERCRQEGDSEKSQWIDSWFDRWTPNLTDEEQADQVERRQVVDRRLTVEVPRASEPSRVW